MRPVHVQEQKNIKICRAVFCVVRLLFNPEESNRSFSSIRLKSQYYLESPRRRRRDLVGLYVGGETNVTETETESFLLRKKVNLPHMLQLCCAEIS